ncbi:MAG: hypothetical protein ACRD3N_19935 [Terracidiphilus sp.]
MAIFLAVCPSLSAQVAPGAATGEAYLHYTFRYSQSAQFGGNRGDWQTTAPSAELDYSNGNSKHLFSLDYAGGYLSTVEGPSYGTGMFQRLLLSEGFVWPKWNVLVSDNVGYRPASPTTGFSGIPGIGEPIGVASPAPPSSQSILTLNTHTVQNTVSGDINHILNFATSLSLGGSSDLLRYPDGNGLNTNSPMAKGGLTFRIDARNSLSAQYLFSQFSYPDYNYTFKANSALFGYQRAWTRSLTSNVSLGPEWIGGSNNNLIDIPSSTAISVQAAVTYQLRSGSTGLSYHRGTTGGSGYQFGAETDSVVANFSREFDKKLTLGLTGGYRRNSELGISSTGLGAAHTIDGEFAGAQASRQLNRFLSFFANYTATTQSYAGSLPNNVLNQLLQAASFGLAYSRGINQSH